LEADKFPQDRVADRSCAALEVAVEVEEDEPARFQGAEEEVAVPEGDLETCKAT
jgi:hypothetical protein